MTENRKQKVEAIKKLLGKPYTGYRKSLQGHKREFVCWAFCREILEIYFHIKLPSKKLDKSVKSSKVVTVPSIVLFKVANDWHSGVVWPDGLHFIHACPVDIFDENCKDYIMREDRLTRWPWNAIVEGYYSYA